MEGDSGFGQSSPQSIRELYEPLTNAVKETMLKLLKRNRQKGTDEDVSLWAANQVKKMTEHAASYTASQIIRAERNRLRREQEERERRRQASQIYSTTGEAPITDYSGGEITYPWTKGKKLGEGGFGAVFVATDNKNLKFAVKQVLKDSDAAESLRKEITWLTKLSHKNIVKCYGYGEGMESLYMYIELMEVWTFSGSLSDKMKETGKGFSENIAKKYTRDVLNGLIHLHSNGIVHRDIKCANVLLNEGGFVKLADMGISKKHDGETVLTFTYAAGTEFWMSPEALSKLQVGKRADIWSLGCTVYEMLKTYPPYGNTQSHFMTTVIHQMREGNLLVLHSKLVKDDAIFSSALKEFLKNIFTEFDARPYGEEVIKYKWLKDA